jgi:hypothetical protein
MKTPNHLICSSVLILLLANALNCQTQTVRSSRIISSVSEIGANKWRVLLSPKDSWFDTGVNAVGGTMIRIFATGRVTWVPPGGRNMASTVGPNGTRPPFETGRARFPMPHAGCGSLIMKIGNSLYAVGEGGFIQVDESGTIRLMVNDDDLSDNSGSFSVDVELVKPLQRIEARGFIFELIEARMLSGRVVVTFLITSNGADREININNCPNGTYGGGGNVKLYDNAGAEYESSGYLIGNKSDPYRVYKAKLVAGIPTVTEVTFNNVSPNANKITLLHLPVMDFETDDKCWNVQFRNIAIVK